MTSQLTGSEQRWLRVRNDLREHRYRLAVCAAGDYPGSAAVESTPLLSTPHWLPDRPIPLDQIDVQHTQDTGLGGVTGTEPAVRRLLPVRADGSRYYT